MRYRLRTLLILLAVLPPVIAVGWVRYQAWQERQRQEALQLETWREFSAKRIVIRRSAFGIPVPPPGERPGPLNEP